MDRISHGTQIYLCNKFSPCWFIVHCGELGITWPNVCNIASLGHCLYVLYVLPVAPFDPDPVPLDCEGGPVRDAAECVLQHGPDGSWRVVLAGVRPASHFHRPVRPAGGETVGRQDAVRPGPVGESASGGQSPAAAGKPAQHHPVPNCWPALQLLSVPQSR